MINTSMFNTPKPSILLQPNPTDYVNNNDIENMMTLANEEDTSEFSTFSSFSNGSILSRKHVSQLITNKSNEDNEQIINDNDLNNSLNLTADNDIIPSTPDYLKNNGGLLMSSTEMNTIIEDQPEPGYEKLVNELSELEALAEELQENNQNNTSLMEADMDDEAEDVDILTKDYLYTRLPTDNDESEQSSEQNVPEIHEIVCIDDTEDSDVVVITTPKKVAEPMVVVDEVEKLPMLLMNVIKAASPTKPLVTKKRKRSVSTKQSKKKAKKTTKAKKVKKVTKAKKAKKVVKKSTKAKKSVKKTKKVVKK